MYNLKKSYVINSIEESNKNRNMESDSNRVSSIDLDASPSGEEHSSESSSFTKSSAQKRKTSENKNTEKNKKIKKATFDNHPGTATTTPSSSSRIMQPEPEDEKEEKADPFNVLSVGDVPDKILEVLSENTTQRYRVVDFKMRQSSLWCQYAEMQDSYDTGTIRIKKKVDFVIMAYFLSLLHNINKTLPEATDTLLSVITIAGWMVTPCIFKPLSDVLKKEDSVPNMSIYKAFMKECFGLRKKKTPEVSRTNKAMLLEYMRSTTANISRHDVSLGNMSRDLAIFTANLLREIMKDLIPQKSLSHLNVDRDRLVRMMDPQNVPKDTQCTGENTARTPMRFVNTLQSSTFAAFWGVSRKFHREYPTRIGKISSLHRSLSEAEKSDGGPNNKQIPLPPEKLQQKKDLLFHTRQLQANHPTCDEMPTRLKLTRSTSHPVSASDLMSLVKQPRNEDKKGVKFTIYQTSHYLRCPNNDSSNSRVPSGKQLHHFHACMTCTSGHHGPATADPTNGKQCKKHMWICEEQRSEHNTNNNSATGRVYVSTMYTITNRMRAVIPDTGEKVHSHLNQEHGPDRIIDNHVQQFTQLFLDTLKDQQKKVLEKY